MITLASRTAFLPGKKRVLIILLLIGLLLFAALSGAVVALGNKYLMLPIFAMMGLFMVLAMPATWILWLMFIALFVALGPLVYFSHFRQLLWLPPLMGSVLLVHVLIDGIRSKVHDSGTPTPGFVYLLGLFLTLVAFATTIDSPVLVDVINSVRFYLFMWPVMFVFMLAIVTPETIEKMWKALLAVALLQVPFVVYQHFFVASKSTRSSPWDAVVGTFPGDIEGGGQSAAMGITLLILMLAAIALWRRQKIQGFWAGLVVFSGIVALALAEVKAVVLMLPVVISLYYWREMVRRPLESFLALLAAGALVAVLFTGYEHFYYSPMEDASNPYSQASTLDRVLEGLRPDFKSKYQNEIGRVTQLVVWWDVNVGKGDIQHTLFGYGAGATQISNIGAGEIARRFPYAVDVTSSSILLWETGLLGHLVFLGLLLSGARLSSKLSGNPAIPDIHQVLLRVGAVGLLILAISLPYKNFAMRSIPMQFLMMLMLGQAGYWLRMAFNVGKKVSGTQRYPEPVSDDKHK